jgi:hypothetical protein
MTSPLLIDVKAVRNVNLIVSTWSLNICVIVSGLNTRSSGAELGVPVYLYATSSVTSTQEPNAVIYTGIPSRLAP